MNNTERKLAIEAQINFAIDYNMPSVLESINDFTPSKTDYFELFDYPMSLGNSKLSFLVANIAPGLSCMSKRLGLCLVKNCYACNSETRYIDSWSFRQRQELAFDKLSVKKLAYSFVVACKLFGKRVVRFQESGDFRTQLDVNKVTDICRILKGFGIRAYTYTARVDLDFSELKKVCSIHISNSNKSTEHGLPYTRVEHVKGFKTSLPELKHKIWRGIVKTIHTNGKNEILCCMDCNKCNACQTTRYNIVFLAH